jgi:hypothetical protein
LTCDGSHPHVPCNGPDAVYSQGYTPSICRAIMEAVQDGKTHSSPSIVHLLHVCISSQCEAQTHSACCRNPHLAPLLVNSMASRRGPSQAKEDSAIIAARLASERARLQAVAEANRKKIAQQKREREEAETAKAVAASSKEARKGAKSSTPPPPPIKPIPKAPTYSSVESAPRGRASTPRSAL